MEKKSRSKTNIKNVFKVLKHCRPNFSTIKYDFYSSNGIFYSSIVDLHYYTHPDSCGTVVDIVDHFTGELLLEGENEIICYHDFFCDKHFTTIEPKDY